MKQLSIANQRWDKWITGAALGALAMYFTDPDQGRRRRARTRDKIHSLMLTTGDARDVAIRDLGNRMQGFRARILRTLTPGNPVLDDQVLVSRVRTCLGRVVSHPHAVQVVAQRGQLALSGPILTHEKAGLLQQVNGLPGVTSVEDRLEVHTDATGVPALQGQSRATQAASKRRAQNWTPALRAAATVGGSALGVYGLARKSPAGIIMAAAGLALLTRGMANKNLTQLVGTSPAARTIDLQKSIEIQASPETVFDAWEKYENFPHFMSHVLTVYDLGDGRSHWIVHGPAGTRLDWNAVLTEHTRPLALAWESEPGAAIEHTGTVRFEPSEHGTRVTVRMSYRPPAGAFGHFLAVLLGSDPKRKLDDDLMRMKSFIESGIVPHDAAKPQPAAGQLLH